MGWWGTYTSESTYNFAKRKKEELKGRGYEVSVRSYGKEVWVQHKDDRRLFGVLLLKKRSGEVLEKDLDYTMNPYTTSRAPRRMVKLWAEATSKEIRLEDIPKALTQYEGYTELIELLKVRLEQGD